MAELTKLTDETFKLTTTNVVEVEYSLDQLIDERANMQNSVDYLLGRIEEIDKIISSAKDVGVKTGKEIVDERAKLEVAEVSISEVGIKVK